jgi:myo-inositol-1(or 4)-monophosphatase
LPAIEADRAAEFSARAAAQLNAAVRDAGKLALSMFGKPIKQWTKGPSSSPVSEADIAVDVLLRERLTGSRNGVAWLSEETGDDAGALPGAMSASSTRSTARALILRASRTGRFLRR